MTILRSFPVLALLTLITCILMIGPLMHAIWLKDWLSARAFFYHGSFFGILAMMVGIALSGRRTRPSPARYLLILLASYALLPAVMAAPVEYLVPSITYSQAYFEMLSSLTTTGATIFENPGLIPDPIHLWRAMAGWMGGFMILVAAVAVLEPLQLGGFEIEAAIAPGKVQRHRARGGSSEARERLLHSARRIAPAYVTFTFVLTLGLVISGDRSLVALSHALSVVSTSGISPLSDFSQAASGYAGELLVFFFLFVVISRRSTSFFQGANVIRDPEYRIALICVFGVAGLLFVRHFLAALEVSEQEDLAAAARALWGSLFNVISFLSTTGFSSIDWQMAQNWSGLRTPGIILLALCMMGGGIATTAGGVKLLRIYALYKHGNREMRRLIHPNSVGGAGVTARRIRREGAQIAWIFLMLFLLGVSVCLVLFTALGQSFDDALALSVAALTNTGPAAQLLNPDLQMSDLGLAERTVFSVAMIFGRVEALVFISLLNPAYWRQ